MDHLKAYIRDIPDFPKPGILFKDITPMLKDPGVFKTAIDGLCAGTEPLAADLICGIESRGFLFGAAMAYRQEKGLIPARKPGKLPYETVSESYALEYGTNTLELHTDSIVAGQRIVVVDDLLATGGTARATGRLIESLGGIVAGYVFVVELSFLNGRDELTQAPIFSLLTF